MTVRGRALCLLSKQLSRYPVCQSAALGCVREDGSRALQQCDRRASSSSASTSEPNGSETSPFRSAHPATLSGRAWPALGGMSIRALAQQVRTNKSRQHCKHIPVLGLSILMWSITSRYITCPYWHCFGLKTMQVLALRVHSSAGTALVCTF